MSNAIIGTVASIVALGIGFLVIGGLANLIRNVFRG